MAKPLRQHEVVDGRVGWPDSQLGVWSRIGKATARTRLVRRTWPAGLAGLLTLTCLGSPQSDIPGASTGTAGAGGEGQVVNVPPPTFDPEQAIVTRTGSAGGSADWVLIPADSVSPPGMGAELWVANLDSEDPPLLESPDADGDYFFTVDRYAMENEFRFQMRTDSSRSDPVDLVLSADADVPLPPVRPLENCLETDPPFELEVEGEGTIDIINGCAEEVTIESVTMRAPSDFSITDAPTSVAAGSTASVTVQIDGTSGEEVLLIQVSSPEGDRRPITLYSGL
jgi:hypothetical protein